jgi:hypothetical protein
MSYTREQVIEVVKSEFSAAQVSSVIDLLDLYGIETHEHQRERVQVAILKLSAGAERLFADAEFGADWYVEEWVVAAESALGPLREGQCYGFRIWPVLGGSYSVDNMVIKTLADWIAASGAVGRQIGDLPDGAQLTLPTGPEVAD